MLHLIQGYGVVQKCAQVLIDEITTLKKRIYKHGFNFFDTVDSNRKQWS